jgi:hypothetical protein
MHKRERESRKTERRARKAERAAAKRDQPAESLPPAPPAAEPEGLLPPAAP